MVAKRRGEEWREGRRRRVSRKNTSWTEMVEARELHALECGGKHGCDSRRWVHRRGVLLVRGSHWRDDNAVPGQGRSQPVCYCSHGKGGLWQREEEP